MRGAWFVGGLPETVPIEITSDVLWRSAAYRLATYASDFIWPDISILAADSRTAKLAEQLFTADWSYKGRHVIGPERTSQFLSLLTRIIQLLTVTIVRERSRNSRLGAEPVASRRKTHDAR